MQGEIRGERSNGGEGYGERNGKGINLEGENVEVKV